MKPTKVKDAVAKAATTVKAAASKAGTPARRAKDDAKPADAPRKKPGVPRTPAAALAPTPGALPRARRPRVAKAQLPAHAAECYARLERAHPDAHCELDHRNALELLVATILSAQCTDRRVNMVTPALFAAYPTARALADAPLEHLEELVKTTGFFRMKAKNIQGMAQALVRQHDGEVPADMAALVALPGVGRKTANVILGNAFDVSEGIVVDTHVGRLAVRLGFTRETDPVKVEQELMRLFPRERWTMLSHLLIFHGRRICEARKPKCGECPLADLCPSALV